MSSLIKRTPRSGVLLYVWCVGTSLTVGVCISPTMRFGTGWSSFYRGQRVLVNGTLMQHVVDILGVIGAVTVHVAKQSKTNKRMFHTTGNETHIRLFCSTFS